LKAYVFDREFYEKMNSMLPSIKHVNLAEHPDYVKVWVESLNLNR